MDYLFVGFGTIVIVFLLVVLLGLQIQVTGLSRRLDEILEKLSK